MNSNHRQKASKSLSPTRTESPLSNRRIIAIKKAELKRAIDEQSKLKSTCKRLRRELIEYEHENYPKIKMCRSASF